VSDVVVVGSGPNGLAAAVVLARKGLSVEVFEGASSIGGGSRTAELTLPGFHHDVCSAVHPLLIASPFFRDVDLAGRGVELRTPKVAFAHPLDGGRAAALLSTLDQTADALGEDAARYRRLLGPLVRDVDKILPSVLAPLITVPRHPFAMARFGAIGLQPAHWIASRFKTEEGRAIVAGAAAHSMLPLTAPLTGSFGLLFIMVAHAMGWPVVAGGSQHIVDALRAELESLGGRVVTDRWVTSLDELPEAKAVMLDVSPRQFVELAGDRLGPRSRRSLERFRYGPGVCKVDWALSGPVPWAAPACREAGTVHVCGPLEEVELSEAEVNAGRHAERPFCLIAQASIVDPTRAPAGQQTLWGYCHVPSGSTTDMTGVIEAQIERFAPGFKDLILARSTMTAADMEAHNPNYIGGDINGGFSNLRQTIFRPTPRLNPYRTALKGVYLCSASTAPGGGVHGMCGLGAARAALADLGLPA
jgi:phytoene dehydrogenase-like protein